MESSYDIAKSMGTNNKAILKWIKQYEIQCSWSYYSAVYKLNTRVYTKPTYSLVSNMLDKALEHLPEHHQLLMHTDQDWHYQMNKYCRALESRGVAQSMSRKGNCYNNSVMVNFFDIRNPNSFT